MIGLNVQRPGGVEFVEVRLIDYARVERARGASLSERAPDVLDMLTLAHTAAARAGDARGFDEWAADVVDVEAVSERPTQQAATVSAG